MPQEIEHWSLTTLREHVVETGAKILSREVTFQMAEVSLPRHRCSRKSWDGLAAMKLIFLGTGSAFTLEYYQSNMLIEALERRR